MATLNNVAAALAEIIRDLLAQGEPVHVPGLGTFQVEHLPSQLEEKPDGEFIIKPPRDTVAFSPEP